MIPEQVLRMNSAPVSASGGSGVLGVGAMSELAVDGNITALSGTTPSIQFFIDRQGADGNWYNVWQSAVLTTTGPVSTSIGASLTVSQSFGHEIQLRWVLGGTNPVVTFSFSINGK